MKNTLIMLSACLVIGIVAGFIAGYKLRGSSDARLAAKYFTDGRQYFDQKKYPNAAEMLNRSIGLDPDLDSAHLLLSSAYRNLGFNELAEEELQASGAPPQKPGQ